MPHVVANNRRLAAVTSPPASSALAAKRKYPDSIPIVKITRANGIRAYTSTVIL